MAFKTITARFAGTCRRCSGPIVAGSKIRFGGRGLTYHLSKNCPASAAPVCSAPAPKGNEFGNDGYEQWGEEAQRIRLAESGSYDCGDPSDCE